MSHNHSATFGNIIPLSIGKIYVSTSITGLPKLQLQSLKQVPNGTAQMLVRLWKCILDNLILRIQLQLLYQCSGIYCIVQSVMESAFRLYLCTFKCILQAVAPV